jgi:hypothetical protein
MDAHGPKRMTPYNAYPKHWRGLTGRYGVGALSRGEVNKQAATTETVQQGQFFHCFSYTKRVTV